MSRGWDGDCCSSYTQMSCHLRRGAPGINFLWDRFDFQWRGGKPLLNTVQAEEESKTRFVKIRMNHCRKTSGEDCVSLESCCRHRSPLHPPSGDAKSDRWGASASPMPHPSLRVQPGHIAVRRTRANATVLPHGVNQSQSDWMLDLVRGIHEP